MCVLLQLTSIGYFRHAVQMQVAKNGFNVGFPLGELFLSEKTTSLTFWDFEQR